MARYSTVSVQMLFDPGACRDFEGSKVR